MYCIKMDIILNLSFPCRTVGVVEYSLHMIKKMPGWTAQYISEQLQQIHVLRDLYMALFSIKQICIQHSLEMDPKTLYFYKNI